MNVHKEAVFKKRSQKDFEDDFGLEYFFTLHCKLSVFTKYISSDRTYRFPHSNSTAVLNFP